MSYEQIKAFGERVQADEALRDEIAQMGQDSAGIVAAAKREGFEFSTAELETFLQSSGSEGDSALDEADLEQIVGGGGYTTSCSCNCMY